MKEVFEIFLILAAAFLANIVTKKIKIPVVIGQILVGIILSPSLLGWVHQGGTIEVLAEIGVVLLMFLAGLESDLKILARNFWLSFSVAVAGVLVPLVSFMFYGLWSGNEFSVSFFYGLIFSATSISITVSVLKEQGKLSTRVGNILLGAAIIDDIFAVFLLSGYTGIFTSNSGSISSFALKFGLQILFFITLFFVYKGVPILWKVAGQLDFPGKAASFALLLCLSLSLLANTVGVSAVIGAYFAGLVIGQDGEPAVLGIEREIQALSNTFFTPVFFVSIALSISLIDLVKHPMLIVGLTVLAVLTKFIPSYLIGYLSNLTGLERNLLGSGMISRGEMALIIAGLGFTDHILSQSLYSEAIIVIILTTLLAPFLIQFSMAFQKSK